MEIFLINSETNETINTYENVYRWGANFVEFTNGGFKVKHYCNENEYFTDKEVIIEQ